MDLALQEYKDYLRYYPNTELAANAQYAIGEIYFTQGSLDSAQEAFDAVLERYPDNNKTPDALYMKGLTLTKMGRKTQGAEEFQELIRRFPSSDLATKACTQVKAVGLKCGPNRAATPRSRRKR